MLGCLPSSGRWRLTGTQQSVFVKSNVFSCLNAHFYIWFLWESSCTWANSHVAIRAERRVLYALLCFSSLSECSILRKTQCHLCRRDLAFGSASQFHQATLLRPARCEVVLEGPLPVTVIAACLAVLADLHIAGFQLLRGLLRTRLPCTPTMVPMSPGEVHISLRSL